MTRSFGPVRGAGVRVIEKESEKSITPGALGTTAYTGITKKGPINKIFRAKTKTDFLFKAGGLIPESQLPDAALSFYRHNEGAGELWLKRITDGNEKISFLEVFNRLSSGALVTKFKAGNGGKWAGRKQRIIDEYASKTENTVTLSNVPSELKQDELVDALVKFKALPGKSYKVESNTDAGVITFASDVNLIDDLDGLVETLMEVDLSNNGEALGVLIAPGTLKPTTEFNLEFYLIEGNIKTLVKRFSDLSIDPQASNYYVDLVNADTDSDFIIKVEDLNIGGSLLAGHRPVNYSNIIETLTDTVLTARIHYLVLSSVANAKAELESVALGSEIIKDRLILTCTAKGARSNGTATFGANPDDGDDVTINGDVFTFKTVPVGAADILIGANAEATIDNAVALITGAAYFVEKASASTMKAFAKNAGVAGDSITTVSSGGVNTPTWGGAVLTGGIAQTWDMVSEKMPFLGTLPIVTGIAFVPSNDFGYGFTLNDITINSTREWDVDDTVTIYVEPLEQDSMVGGYAYPLESAIRNRFQIISNDANKITVKPGSKMTLISAAGETFATTYVQQLSAGYDGLADIVDITYEEAYDTGTSQLKALRGKNLGLVKLATPGITSMAVQKAGVGFAESQNWQYRYEIPASILSESAVEEYINETIGRNDFAKVSWPSYIKVSKAGGGIKLITATGGIHGLEAKVARDFDGFHKAAAGEDVILDQALGLPDGFGDEREELDEEFLNPQGINIIKNLGGNFVLWGDRTVGIDPAFKFAHQREYLSHVENIFLENFNFIIFALNSRKSGTQEILKSAFIVFFTPEFAKSAVVGTDLQDAIRLKIDSENNTDTTRAQGDLFADMSLRIVDTVERFTIRIGKQGVTEDVAA